MPLFENERTMSLKKQLLMLPLIAVAATGCVESDSPIVILNRLVMSDTCTVVENVYRPSGSLNLSAGMGYPAFFDIESNMQGLSTDVDGEVVAGPDQNDFISERIDITYSSPSGAAVPAAVTVPYYAAIRAGAPSGDNSIVVDLLPQAARVALAGVGAQGATILAEFQMHGRLRSGRAISSNTVSYPIQVYEAPVPTCPFGYLGTGECGSMGGQDGAPIVCADDPSATP